jgi:hypothetical protein
VHHLRGTYIDRVIRRVGMCLYMCLCVCASPIYVRYMYMVRHISVTYERCITYMRYVHARFCTTHTRIRPTRPLRDAIDRPAAVRCRGRRGSCTPSRGTGGLQKQRSKQTHTHTHEYTHRHTRTRRRTTKTGPKTTRLGTATTSLNPRSLWGVRGAGRRAERLVLDFGQPVREYWCGEAGGKAGTGLRSAGT